MPVSEMFDGRGSDIRHQLSVSNPHQSTLSWMMCAQMTSTDRMMPTTTGGASTLTHLDGAAHASASTQPVRTSAVAQTGASQGRWKLLKRALCKSSARTPGVMEEEMKVDVHSVRAHTGFKLLPMNELSPRECEKLIHQQANKGTGQLMNCIDLQRFYYVHYQLPEPYHVSPMTDLFIRVRRPTSVTLAELAPSQRVDNTGNICIWNSEEILAYLALKIIFPMETHLSQTHTPLLPTQSTPPTSSSTRPPLRILELGGGMSGLCGLALHSFARSIATSATSSAHHSFPSISDILITDGNTTCIEEGVKYQIEWNELIRNQSLTSDSTSSGENSFAYPIPKLTADVLCWDRHADYSHLGRFDVILAADCLFFRDYHLDLCHVLRSLLTPDTGRAYLLAPSRGGSLEKFVDYIQPLHNSSDRTTDEHNSQSYVAGLKVIQLSDHYDDLIWQQHQQFLSSHNTTTSSSTSSSSTYSVDLHYPHLLTLQYLP